MSNPRQVVRLAINHIDPFDKLEREHRFGVLSWIDSGVPIFRISKPDNPPKHLVSYFVLFDEIHQSVMLIDHIKATSWLPPGGHVDINEDPYKTVIREAAEELQIEADFSTIFGKQPLFVTVTVTKNADTHTDVSLWYVIKGNINDELIFDANEMNGCKWIGLNEVLAMNISELDPHMHRFIKKMKRYLITSN